MANHHTKLLVIGSGAAGCTASIYAARAMLKPIMVRGLQPGGQLTITTDVENYPGFAEAVQGPWLMEQMEKQAAHVGTSIMDDIIANVDFSKRPFTATGESGDTYTADSLVIATGATAKWLGIESEQKFQGFGISACATCDGFFFKGQEVVVIGGGNSAVEEALYLSGIASKVTLIHRRDSLRAEKIAQERLFSNSKIHVEWNVAVDEFLGGGEPLAPPGVRLKRTQDGSTKQISCQGAFVAIGHKPNTEIFIGQVEMDKEGYIITTPGSTKTNVPGVYAAGDVQDKIFRQAVTAAGTGCMAALEAEKFLAASGKH
ncbi:MAG: thioredoxin-disulfide reductase [Alphaproteobacteria bacterium]